MNMDTNASRVSGVWGIWSSLEWVGLEGDRGGSSALELPCPSLTPQSLFERQGLPGPEKLPGSLRKGIPRTKSVGTAGLREN